MFPKMAQLTTEEREFVFELGYEISHLRNRAEIINQAELFEGTGSSTKGEDANETYLTEEIKYIIKDIQDYFEGFRQKALKYGMELESGIAIIRTPQKNCQFIRRQFDIARRHMENQLEYTKTQYNAGVCSSRFVFDVCKILKNAKRELNPGHELLIAIDHVAKSILNDAEILDVDKSQLESILDRRYALSLDESNLKRKLKILLCGGRISSTTQNEVKRSKVDTTRVITDGCWCVSLVRLPDRNAQHAFLVLEGKEGTKSMIWFTDFVAKEWFDTLRPGTQDGMVRIKHFESKESEDKLLFKCKSTLMDVGASDRLLFSSWLITKSTARRLIENIEKQANTPPKYHVLGDNSVAALSSGKSSSNPTGHNCFTFAKKMLRDLDDVHIQLPEDSLETWLFSATSRYLTDKRLLNRKWYEKPGYQMMAAFILGIVVAVALLKIG